MNVTVFKNFSSVVEQTTLLTVLDQIKNGKYKDQVNELQKVLESGNQRDYSKNKKLLPAFTPSGSFQGGRKLEFLIKYSGCIILDIDKLTPLQLDSAFKSVINSPYTFACFRSPSYNGMKILIKCDSTHLQHQNAYNEVMEFYSKNFNLQIDTSGKDVTRLCFFSFDKNLFINQDSEIFITAIGRLENDIKIVVEQIESAKLDITNGYNDWMRIGFALADALGEEGRDYFHRISRFNDHYNCTDCNKQFDSCLKSNKSGATAKTFFFLAKDHGIDISPEKPIPVCPERDIINAETKNENQKTKKNHFDIIEKFLVGLYSLRYNIVNGKIEVKSKGKEFYEPMTDYFENSIFRKLHKSNIKVSMAKLRCILLSDFCILYDPFKEYFNHLPEWDGKTDFIQQLAETVVTTQNELWYICFRKWIVAVVASLLDPKVVNHTAIIFSGPQGIGKTTWMEKLCPIELRAYLFSGTINPNNKDTLIQIVECMFINLDELENMNRTEVGTLKEIITKSVVRIRRSYGHNNESLIRRASFMGSVNSSQFLNDPTGSRRFLCFDTSCINYIHNIEMSNVYAQAFALYKNNFCFYFDKEEGNLISQNNEKFQVRTAEEELLLAWFKPAPLLECEYFLPATLIMAKLSLKAPINVTNGSIISIGKALKKHGFIKTKKGGVYVWGVKEINIIDMESDIRSRPDEV